MPSPSRSIAGPAALALVGLLALVLRAGTVEAGPGWGVPTPRGWALADSTDSTDVDSLDSLRTDSLRTDSLRTDSLRTDSLRADSLRRDTTDVDSTARARAYLPGVPRDGYSVSLYPRHRPGLRGRLGTFWRRDVTLDSTAYTYSIREIIGQDDVRTPTDLGLAAYLTAQRESAIASGFRDLAERRSARTGRRNGFGFSVDIPGGQQSAFRTLFGKNEVDLTVNGTSNVSLGMSYDQNGFQESRGQGASLDPAFGQELNLSVAGTVGDKLRVNVNYDTETTFDFENQVSLAYTGYQDDIVQKFEAGNVFLETPSELVRGGQRLFGLKTNLQFGPLAVTAVASQQDAETKSTTIEGGSQSTPFGKAPAEYEDATHFFLGYFFHNWWDRGHQAPGLPTLPPGLQEIIGIKVYKHEPRLATDGTLNDETVYAVALADLAEPRAVIAGGEEYLAALGTGAPLPNPTLDQYTDADLARIRSQSSTVSFGADFGLPDGAYSNNKYRLLRENVDYSFDKDLGWLSLTQGLTERDELAVAYQYRTSAGAVVTVGDFTQVSQGNSQSGARTVLKLLRADLPSPSDPLWDLTMKNVYKIGGSSLNPNSFTLKVTYEPPGSPVLDEFPNVVIGSRLTLLQILGLDRINPQGNPSPDNTFDFRAGLTIDPSKGRIIFPVRQPFGDYLRGLLQTGRFVDGTAVGVSPTPSAETVALLVPSLNGEDLYDIRATQARDRLPQLSRYKIEGEFKGSTQSIFNVGGLGLVEGSVRVTAGGQQLAENADFRVNYTSGTVEIINPLFLQSGQKVQIEVEQNKFISIGGKTLVGMRADYRLGEGAGLGATWMRLAERPLTPKFRIGEEALNNSILGVDGRYDAEPRWLTRALDALPLLQTREPSRIELRGEFARLSPGHPQSYAFDVARRELVQDGFDLKADEINGLSFIDDFENSENIYTGLQEAGAWRIAAPPDSAGPNGGRFAAGTVTDPRLASNWRSRFAWYTINERNYEDFEKDGLLTRATAEIPLRELYPGRCFGSSDQRDCGRPVGFLDLYVDPTERGPYNYTTNLAGTLRADPRTAWGGMVRQLEGAYSDFQGQNNVEFVQIILSPLGGRSGTERVQPGARLVLDMGRINEDVLDNNVLNTEDGLRVNTEPSPAELDRFGRKPTGQNNGVVDFFSTASEAGTGRTEDLGLDGLPSRVTDVAPGGKPYSVSEVTYFADFLSALPPGPDQARAARDPSSDDYHYFLDDAFFDDAALFPGGASVQERYSYYYPPFENNSLQAQDEIVLSGHPGISTRPNSEDINSNSTVDEAELYHRYTIPLDDAGLQRSPFFQNTITASGETFYILRIPIRTENRVTAPGLDRDDFSKIEAVRLWTTGHDRPATIRIASFELVGSRWLKSDQVGFRSEGQDAPPPGEDPLLFIESINTDENDPIYAVPRGAIRNVNPSTTGSGTTRTPEKSIVFRAERLPDGRRAGIVRSYATSPRDLTKYTNLRMFVHGDGFERRDSVRAFIRLGDDETENYYEFEQPLYPFDPDRVRGLDDRAQTDSLWQTNVPVGGERVDLNSINILLTELNRLKVDRDEAGASPSEVFRSDRTPEGAPPGARISIRGQPSIQDVKTIVLGVRNAEGGDVAPLDTVTVWFNELRVSGYDEAGGSSGFLTANVKLADVGTVNARMSFQQDGFGDLGGTLGGRTFAGQSALSLTSSFNAHKLLPERFGWLIPVSFSLTQNAQTPRFDPERGDIRLSELQDRAADQAAEGDAPTLIDAQQVVERAQTATSSRTFRVTAAKSGSRSPWLRYTLDGLNASYSSTAQTARNPTNALNDGDSWTANAAYRLTVPRPKTLRPFWLLDDVPVLGLLGGLRFNYLPQSVRLSADANRRTTTTLPRLRADDLLETDLVQSYLALRRRTHAFDHGRQIDVQYNPFSFLTLGYGSDVGQDLGAAGQEERFDVLVRGPDPDDPTQTLSRQYALDPTTVRTNEQVLADFGIETPAGASQLEVLDGSGVRILPFGTVLGGLLSGERPIRTQDYAQTLSASVRISTQKAKWLRWIRLQPFSYQSSYSWRNVPVPSKPTLEVAGAGTRVQFQSGLALAPREFWRLFPFYRNWEAAAKERPATTDSTRGGFRLGRLARGLGLAATGVEDVTFTYRGSLASSAGGVEGGAYSLLAGLNGQAPPLGFRLGLDRSLDIDRRLADPESNLRYEDLFTDQHSFESTARLEPIKGLRIGLRVETGFQKNDQVPFSIVSEEGADPFVRRLPSNIRGSGESTVLSFGSSYTDLLERHVERLRSDATAIDEDGVLRTEFLQRNGLAADFQSVFARGTGVFGPSDLFRLPMPNWDVSYSGLSSWPVFRWLTESVTLKHGYSSKTQVDYASLFESEERAQPFRLSSTESVQLLPPLQTGTGGYEAANTIVVNERYQPLIGLALGLKGGIQTDLTWNRSHLFTLTSATAGLVEKNIEDIQLQMSYAKTGLRLLGLRRLNNNLRLTITASYGKDESINRPFRENLQEFLLIPTDTTVTLTESQPIRTRRVSIWPRISYTISNQVTADVFVRFERSTPEGTQAFPTKTFDGGVNLRILFSN